MQGPSATEWVENLMDYMCIKGSRTDLLIIKNKVAKAYTKLSKLGLFPGSKRSIFIQVSNLTVWVISTYRTKIRSLDRRKFFNGHLSIFYVRTNREYFVCRSRYLIDLDCEHRHGFSLNSNRWMGYNPCVDHSRDTHMTWFLIFFSKPIKP